MSLSTWETVWKSRWFPTLLVHLTLPWHDTDIKHQRFKYIWNVYINLEIRSTIDIMYFVSKTKPLKDWIEDKRCLPRLRLWLLCCDNNYMSPTICNQYITSNIQHNILQDINKVNHERSSQTDKDFQIMPSFLSTYNAHHLTSPKALQCLFSGYFY